MGALGFIASVIDSLAWPAVVVILVLALQAPLDKLLPELKRFRYGEVEIDFGREVRELEAPRQDRRIACAAKARFDKSGSTRANGDYQRCRPARGGLSRTNRNAGLDRSGT